MTQGNQLASYALFALVVAILGSWTALEMQRQVRTHEGRVRQYWLLGAALASGLSIWAASFIVILGYETGMPTSYSPGAIIAALATAVIETAAAFSFVQRGDAGRGRMALGGVSMGTAIVLSTYLAISAITVPADKAYSVGVVIVSCLVAMSLAGAAVTTATRAPSAGMRVLAAVILGASASGMHHAALAAVSFATYSADMASAGLDQATLALLVGSATTMLLLLGIMSAVFDRRIGALALKEATASAESERHLRQILARMPLGIVAVSSGRDYETVFTNPTADAILDGRQPLSLPFLDAEGRALPALDNPFRRALEGTSWPDRALARIARPDGRFGFLEISATRLQDGDGATSEIVFMINDATARIDAETALSQAQKLETIGQLTGGVAHDFNNLLTPIMGGLDMLRREKDLSPRATRVIEGAMQASQRAATLVQRLLAFARRQTLQARTVDARTLLVGLEDLIGRSIGPVIDTTIEAPPGLGVRVDPGQLELAILNLSVNARDAMPDGGRLSISASSVRIDGHEGLSLPNGEYVQISVADNGTGMSGETQRRAIEPFFSTKGVGKGTGLGLSMAHGLAAQSQGELRIVSAPGVGTRIDLFLPRVEMQTEEATENSAPEGPSAAPTTILLVDDEEIVRRATADTLADLGHEVIEASSGIQALGLLRATPGIRLVVTDHLMPGMTGAALAGEIATLAPSVPVLIITGYANPDELPRHLPFLAKPFRRRDLVRNINALLIGGDNVHRLTRKA